jgi:hypothetical protein
MFEILKKTIENMAATIPIVTNIFFEIINPFVPDNKLNITNCKTINLVFKKHQKFAVTSKLPLTKTTTMFSCSSQL